MVPHGYMYYFVYYVDVMSAFLHMHRKRRSNLSSRRCSLVNVLAGSSTGSDVCLYTRRRMKTLNHKSELYVHCTTCIGSSLRAGDDSGQF